MTRQERRRKRDYFDPPMGFVPLAVEVPTERCSYIPPGAKKGKLRYPDSVSALMSLANIRAKDSTRRGSLEQRAYYCPRCEGHHLTSQARRDTPGLRD